ncbi:MAG: ABC transporter permease [Caldiserica bacterium]|nr:MAG: ABC transporter permease [Caldisericota bacterium]
MIILQTLRISIPYILASNGGVYSERSGIVNIALEGMILMGAFTTVIVSWYTNSFFLGVLGGILGGASLALIHAFVCIQFKVNQIISGLAINILSFGLTKFILKIIFHSSSNSERIGVSMPSFLGVPVLIYITLLIVILNHIIINKTKFGLHLRSVGENPLACSTLGINVYLIKYIGVITSGILCGLAGSWLALDQHQFVEGMSGGRGFIALAALIFGRWTPLGAFLASLLFGFAESIQIYLQTVGLKIPTQFIQMIPYLLTIIVLVAIRGKYRPPKSLGIPF